MGQHGSASSSMDKWHAHSTGFFAIGEWESTVVPTSVPPGPWDSSPPAANLDVQRQLRALLQHRHREEKRLQLGDERLSRLEALLASQTQMIEQLTKAVTALQSNRPQLSPREVRRRLSARQAVLAHLRPHDSGPLKPQTFPVGFLDSLSDADDD